ncbi:cardiac-enriched FHL2-interacting protein [Cebidichthys violaceus]|uniref:cardiac-enriched FHL2-interacting protein n=1 Tax=Cebidichthys violaceus TaxID=271503 RepID=UPI0035CA78EE
MTSVEKRRSGRKCGGHRKHSDGGYSDTSSGGSYPDETDREVSNLTDRAFRSLCIGDEAVYNDSDLCSSSPCTQRDRQLAFSQSGQNRDGNDKEREELKRPAHESFSLRMQQYGQDWIQGGIYEAEIQRDPQWEVYGERTQGRVSATFQHSFVETSQQEESLGEEQSSFLSNGSTELSTQQRRSRSRVSSLIRAFNSEGRDGAGMDGKVREWNDETSWDKSALMSIQRELSEFSTSYQQNFNSNHFPSAGPFSSPDTNFYSSEVAAAAHMNSASSVMRSSHSKYSMSEQFDCNSNFFIHSEFSPFKNKTAVADDSLQITGIMVTVREKKPSTDNGQSTQEQINVKECSNSELDKCHPSSGLEVSKENTSSKEGSTVQTTHPTVKEDPTRVMNKHLKNVRENPTLETRQNNVSENATVKRTNHQLESSSINARPQLHEPLAEKRVPSSVTVPTKNKVLAETQPLLYKQDIIATETKDYTNETSKENSAKSIRKDEVKSNTEEKNPQKRQAVHTNENFMAKVVNTAIGYTNNSDRADAKTLIKHDDQPSVKEDMPTVINPTKTRNIDGKSAPLVEEKGCDSTTPKPFNKISPSNHLTENENTQVFPKHHYKETHIGGKHQMDDNVNIGNIAIRVVPAETEKDNLMMVGKHHGTIVPSDVFATNEQKQVASSGLEEKVNSLNNKDGTKDLISASAEKQIKHSLEDTLGVQCVSSSVRKRSDSLQISNQQSNINANSEVTQAEKAKPENLNKSGKSVDKSKIRPMVGDYFQLQGVVETNNEPHNHTNVGGTSEAVSKVKELPGLQPNKAAIGNESSSEGKNEDFMLDQSKRKTVESSCVRKNRETEGNPASKQSYGPTERQSNKNEKTEAGQVSHIRKHHTENQSSLSARERQITRNSNATKDNMGKEKPEVKPIPKERVSTIPEISAIADYARLKVIVSEDEENTIQEFPPNKKEGFFPLIQSRHSRRPVFTADPQDFSVKDKHLPNKTEVSPKVNKEAKPLVFPITEKEHQRTGMFKLADKERQEKMPLDAKAKECVVDTGAKHAQHLKEINKSPTTPVKNQGSEEQVSGTDAQRVRQVEQSILQPNNPPFQAATSSSVVNRPRSTSVSQHLKPLDHSTPHEKPVGQVYNIVGSRATPRKDERTENALAKVEQERTEKIRQERLATQHEETKAQHQRTAKQFDERQASRIEEEKRAEDMRVKHLLEENRASLAKEERRAAQREEERRLREREAIANKIKERREKQREAERRAEEKQAVQKEEEMRAQQKEEERRMREIEEKRRIKIEEGRIKKLREEEERMKENEERRRVKQQEDEKAAQEEQQRRAAQEQQKRADQEEQQRRAAQEEQQRRAAQEEQQRRAAQEEQQRRAAQDEQQWRADQEEQQRRAAQEQQRRADQEEQQRRAAQEQQRRADQEEQQRIAAQEQQRRADQEEQQRRAAQEEQQRRAAQEEQQMRAAQEEQQRRAAKDEQQWIADQEVQQRRADQEVQQRRADQEVQQRRADQEEQQMRADQEEHQRRADQEEQQRRADQEEHQRRADQKEQQRKAAKDEQQRRAAKDEQQRRADQEEQHRRADQEVQQRRADQEEQQRRADQKEHQRRADQEEQQRRADQDEQQRRADQEEHQRRAAQEVQQRRAALIEEQMRAKHIEEKILADTEEKKKRKQRKEGEEEKAAHISEEERVKQEQEIEEPRRERCTNEHWMRTQREEDEKRAVEQEKTIIKQREKNQTKEERNRRLEESQAALTEEEKRVAQEWMLAQREDEIRAKKREGEEEEKLANQREKERDTRKEEQKRAGLRMDALQYYAITSTESERKPRERQQCSPLPSQQVRRSSENSGSHTRPYRSHAPPSPAPSLPRSNASSPALGAKPLMFRVKDNTIRGSFFTKSVKPRFHKNFGEDIRVGSPMERGSEREEDEQEIMRRSAGTPVYPDTRSAYLSQDYSAPLLQHKPYSRRSIALDEDDSRSVISNMSEGGESFATSAADLADIRGLYDYERPESACSYSSDISRTLGKPPTIPPKSDKALRRAQRLTTRRIKKELSKNPADKSLQDVSSIPSCQALASPHFSSPVSLAHAPTLPSSHTEHQSSHSSFYASPHATGPISLPVASPHATAPVSLPDASPIVTGPASHTAALKTVAHVPSSSTHHHDNHQAPVAQYHVESSYPHSYPLTQRKVLQDLGSGQYFVVDVPVQVKTKTFIDPETGKYVQLNVRQSGQNTARPQPQQTYPQPQLQPQMQVKLQQQPQASPATKPCGLYQGNHCYPQDYQPQTITSVPCGSSAPLTLHQDQQPVGESHGYGYPAHEMGQKSEGHRYSPEKTPYMDTVNDKDKTYNTVYNTHGPNEWFPESDTNSQLAGSSICENDNSAHSQCQPRDIITMSELDDFMEMSDW